MSRLLPLARSTGRRIWKSVAYVTVPLGFFGARPMSTMLALSGSLGSTSPMICPLMRSYGPTAPKFLPPKVGDSVLVITTCVTRACTGGAPQKLTPVNAKQQATAVVGIGALIMTCLPCSLLWFWFDHSDRSGWREAAQMRATSQKPRRLVFPAGGHRRMRTPSHNSIHHPHARYRYPQPFKRRAYSAGTLSFRRCAGARLFRLRQRAHFRPARQHRDRSAGSRAAPAVNRWRDRCRAGSERLAARR